MSAPPLRCHMTLLWTPSSNSLMAKVNKLTVQSLMPVTTMAVGKLTSLTEATLPSIIPLNLHMTSTTTMLIVCATSFLMHFSCVPLPMCLFVLTCLTSWSHSSATKGTRHWCQTWLHSTLLWTFCWIHQQQLKGGNLRVHNSNLCRIRHFCCPWTLSSLGQRSEHPFVNRGDWGYLPGFDPKVWFPIGLNVQHE